MSLEPGQVIESKYRIVRLLGEGGMGAVYEGENVAIQRRVAIKVLHANVADNKDAVSRFEKEAKAAGKIGSDHITEVLDMGQLESGDRFMVMEYLDGVTLSHRIKERGRLTPSEAAPAVAQLLEGLGAAHDAGIIHRDLKPDNVFLLKSKAGRKDFVKILDFGISKFNQLAGDSGMSMTRTGSVMGTPYYMSPEQAKGAKDIDNRSDLYSVGVILYEAITGQVPFNADTFNELIFKIVLEAPPPPESIVPDLDPAFSAILRKSMAREPAQRFQTAAEFQAALGQWMQTGNISMFEESSTVGARAPMASISGVAPVTHPQTPTPWSQTGGDLAPPKRSSAGLMVAIGIAGVVVLGGGAFVMTRVIGGDKGSSGSPANATPSAETAPPPPATTTEKVETPPPASAVPSADAPPAKSADARVPPVGVGVKVPGGAAPPSGNKPPPAGNPPPGGRKIRTEL